MSLNKKDERQWLRAYRDFTSCRNKNAFGLAKSCRVKKYVKLGVHAIFDSNIYNYVYLLIVRLIKDTVIQQCLETLL